MLSGLARRARGPLERTTKHSPKVLLSVPLLLACFPANTSKMGGTWSMTHIRTRCSQCPVRGIRGFRGRTVSFAPMRRPQLQNSRCVLKYNPRLFGGEGLCSQPRKKFLSWVCPPAATRPLFSPHFAAIRLLTL